MSEEKKIDETMDYILGLLFHADGPWDAEEARRHLNNPDFPGRNEEFRLELDAAIQHGTFTPEEYEKLTEKDFETPAEVAEDLRSIRKSIYGE